MERHYELNAPPPDLPAVLGPGGEDVLALLDGLSVAPGRVPDHVDGLPVRQVGQVPAELLDRVEPGWLAALECRRARARTHLMATGRESRLELAEHVAMLVATPRLEPAEPGDGDALAQSGAILWLLGTLVAAALTNDQNDTTLAGLVARGWWPVGPVDGAFVIAPLTLPRTCHA
ncbi:hypothetical protein [Nonomuraea endophytica]|uniref:hypothetical protein n=1 Tax=Nonomuraea endophytica TaxID=714136 RepID=UPI0037CAF674